MVADLARRAEDAGWDGLFVWDHVTHRKELRRTIADPWVLLTAAALATRTIRLGTMVTPIARRRVPKLAREVTTLDRLTGGRMILGAGLGSPIADEFGSFGETTDEKELAARLDEGLEALNLLWSGEPVTFRGDYVRIEDVVFLPMPVQRPRVPIWGRSISAPHLRRPGGRRGADPAVRRRRAAAPAGCRDRPRGTRRLPGRVPHGRRARRAAIRAGHVGSARRPAADLRDRSAPGGCDLVGRVPVGGPGRPNVEAVHHRARAAARINGPASP